MTANHVEDRVRTAVGPLRVREVGSGPPALLWHSLFVDGTSWCRVEQAWAEHRRLVVVDGPGHGASGDPGRRYTLTDCATAAVEVLDHLGIADPVDWVGNAWGGHVGIVAAVTARRRLRSLAAFGTPVRAYHPAERRRVQLLAAAYRVLGPVAYLVDGVTEVQLSPTTRATDPEAVAISTAFLRRADRRLLYRAIQSISIHREDQTPRLPQLRVPTLLVTGRDHSGFTPEEAARVVTATPDARLEVVEDAAYLIPLEQPGRTTALLLDFWASLP